MVQEGEEGGQRQDVGKRRKTMATLYFIAVTGYSSQRSHCQAPGCSSTGGITATPQSFMGSDVEKRPIMELLRQTAGQQTRVCTPTSMFTVVMLSIGCMMSGERRWIGNKHSGISDGWMDTCDACKSLKNLLFVLRKQGCESWFLIHCLSAAVLPKQGLEKSWKVTSNQDGSAF